MKRPLSVAIGMGLLGLLVSGVAYDAHGTPSPLVVRVATNRQVYRLGRSIRITLTETNTSDHEVPVATGCQILHGFITHDSETVWTFHDYWPFSAESYLLVRADGTELRIKPDGDDRHRAIERRVNYFRSRRLCRLVANSR